ncbi:uncharacterized protein [Atheta coriaria]|uniref:uncharacterized protein n=1 Tax=Dalotia coriaria TaxID=877792 RepID=UPI0031F39380
MKDTLKVKTRSGRVATRITLTTTPSKSNNQKQESYIKEKYQKYTEDNYLFNNNNKYIDYYRQHTYCKTTENSIKIDKTKTITSTLPVYKKPLQKSPKKQVQFRNNAKTLRPRKPNKKYVDYENSLTQISDEESDDDKNVPIYKQIKKAPVKKPKDVYEFNADSYDKSQSDSDNEYDKEMIQEMKQIKKVERKQTVDKIIKKIVRKNQNKKDTAPVVKEPKAKVDVKVLKPVKEAKKINIQQNIVVNIPEKKKMDETHVIDQDITPPEENFVSELVDSFMQPENVNKTQHITFKRPEIGGFHRVYANSTMTKAGASSPARSNLILRNGPYFLQTKGDCLPSFNQDTVLNSTTVESHEPLFNCRISAILPQPATTTENTQDTHVKRTKQTSILNFISAKPSEEDNMHCTLFDEHLMMSPVKNSTPVRSINISPDKRRVLRDLTNIGTPEREESDVEFFALSARAIPVAGGKPTRFVLKSPKKIENNVDIDVEIEQNHDQHTPEDSPAADSKNLVDTKNLVGIYENFSPLEVTRNEMPSFTYTRRRKRLASYTSEPSDDAVDDHKPKKRKKREEMTKKEKAEFQSWAASFNKMCEDIEGDTLEVE